MQQKVTNIKQMRKKYTINSQMAKMLNENSKKCPPENVIDINF